MRRIFIALVALAVAGLIAFEALTSGSGQIGKPAPPLPPAVLNPPRVRVEELRGKPAVITFWASWCDPCRKEAPEIERFSRSMRGAAAVVGVDYTDSEGSARSFLRRYGWTFPVLSDPNGTYGDRYGLVGLPTTVVLDAGGRIVETLRGPQTESSLRTALGAAS